MQQITPHLWFDRNCEEAMNFYVSVFKNSKILSLHRYPTGIDDPHMKGMEGKVLHGEFELNGQKFMALDGGPIFKFNESVSFYVVCKDQEEVDYYWNKLTADGGQESMCGWLKDKYGLSWQIAPAQLEELLGSPDRERSNRAMQAMLKMKKIIIADLQKAYDGK
jgi:predicted 3-demethylubiquinone-9 3-methyltransferase (glyoxalase superfamily)